uniref:Transient receptor potential cation channel subfamily M member 3-like n=1 Tax=Octopus vulgaris TaxID=6645 RepID=A0A6C0PNM5_OCTVU|nr:transient receptor potential cation channel subfamily M member 3-like [Octopus vulgaris]
MNSYMSRKTISQTPSRLSLESPVLEYNNNLANSGSSLSLTMLQVNKEYHNQSRTSLASIFEDLAIIRRSFLKRGSDMCQRAWIERVFCKRECIRFIPSSRDHSKCCCGREEDRHVALTREIAADYTEERWHPLRHTEVKPTDAYGTIEFQGAPHPSKAQYVRLSSFDSKVEHILELLQKFWGLDLPKLLITVHGGILNFDLQPKLKRVFRKGLLKAAKTTGAWIVTGGTNTGVTRHVGDAISDLTTKAKNKVVAIGIASWGIVENKELLIGSDKIVPYHCVSSPKTNCAVLNSNHSYFLLIDNGTVGKYGGEILLRKKLEKYISQQKICINSGVKGRGVPVICVVLEGGANTIRSVLEYVTDSPPIPVVVCDGSGRAADLLAFTHKYTSDDGIMLEGIRDQLIVTIQKTFQYTQMQAEKLFIELMLCVKKKELITVFRLGEADMDLAILTALLKAVISYPSKDSGASAPDQLSLTLTWDRVDIARSHIFVYGQNWPEGSLEQAMMDALINDRVDFVKLLLENGVSMRTFLTIPRLEELYNTRHGPTNTLRYLIRDVKKNVASSYRCTLPDIGLVLQHLMGGGFVSSYLKKSFRQKYNALKKNVDFTAQGASLGNVVTSVPTLVNTKSVEELFSYPFHDLMVWAVLMKRQKMALFMWQHGEEAMAKALLACKLYKAMAHEADQDDLEVDISDELRKFAEEFQTLALELLEHCYKVDDDYTQQLLTYELKNFSDQTCLSLAVAANHREFVAHTCCQMLLNDMWMGGLRMRKNTALRVILGIFLPPYILLLEFKSKEELLLMPQTMEEHLDDMEEEASENDRVSISSFDEAENEYGEDIDNNSIGSTTVPAPPPTAINKDVDVLSNALHPITFPDKPLKKKSPLKPGKKLYEFYNAPITKFWAHTISYMTFLFCFTYIVLLRTLPVPRWQEYYVIAYIGTLALEKMRMVIAAEPVQLLMKLRVYLANIWNIWDTCAILFFSLGVCLRFNKDTLQASRLVYIVDVVLWYIRILEVLSVNKYLGPYLKIICKLLRDMSYFIIILFIVLISFGIVRQAVHYQHEDPSWHIARNVFFYPYWMIYGELFAEEIDPCTNPDMECSYGAWVAPALMCVYLLVANILLVNLLIARFNATFIRNNANSREIWKFQRYQLIIVYELRPLLPPPLILLSHLFLTLKFIKRRCQGKRDYFDNGLKLFLSHEDTEKLHAFEEENVEDYFREKDSKFQSSTDERIRVISDRVDSITTRMEDMYTKENAIKLSHQTIDYRLSRLEEIAAQMGDSLAVIEEVITTERHPVFSDADTNIDYTSDESLQPTEDNSSPKTTYPQKDQLAAPSLFRPSLSKRGSVSNRMGRLSDHRPSLLSKRSPSIGLKRSWSLCSRSPKFANTSPLQMKRPSLFQFHDAMQKASLQNYDTDCTGEPSSNLNMSKLQKRRNVTANLHVNLRPEEIQEDCFNSNNSPPNLSPTTCNASSVKFNEALPEKSVYSTAPIESDTRTATLVPGKTMTLDLLKPKDTQFNRDAESQSGAIIGHTPVSPLDTPNSPSSGVAFGSFSVYEKYQAGTSAGQMPSLLTSLNPEYTTITDDIDTSYLMDTSSPATSSIFFSDQDEKYFWNSEEKALKQAEEVEHHRMERVIRNRLRQISLDDTDGISDIAKIVVSEMEGNQKHTPPDAVVDVDEEDITLVNRPACIPQVTVENKDFKSSSVDRSLKNIEIKVIRASIDRGGSCDSDRDPQC